MFSKIKTGDIDDIVLDFVWQRITSTLQSAIELKLIQSIKPLMKKFWSQNNITKFICREMGSVHNKNYTVRYLYK